MKNKIIIFGLMILILITCSAIVFAEDSLDNSTLTTSDEEIGSVPLDEDVVETPSSEITITDDNYDDYFNKYTGKFKSDVDVSNINTVKISNVSNKVFTIDKPLNLMPASDNCEIKNGVIHLIEGSSGSNITNLVINNTKGELYQDGLFVCKLHGIWFSNSSDNLIFNNTIRIPGAEGCYAMPMGYSSRNKILYNDILSTFTSCIVMGLSNYNNISYNRMEILSTRDVGVTSNVIYFNPWGHADYYGAADCIGTYISNNYIKNSGNSVWAYTVNVLGQSNFTTIINNTVIGGYYGIKVLDEYSDGIQAKNIIINDNTIINSSNSIYASTYNVNVSKNKIIGSSMEVGIIISGGRHKHNASIFGNEIVYDNLYSGIYSFASANIFNNTIRLSRYGTGIVVLGDNSSVVENNIHAAADYGISIGADNVIASKNVIHTKSCGFNLQSDSELFKFQNNVIINNKIYSDDYAVYIRGYVYNTTIGDNYIETNQSEAFYIDMFQTLEDNNPGKIEDNTVNGVIKDTEILIIDDINFYEYFDEEGYLKYDFKDNSQRILFLRFLSNKNLYFTDSITLTSNKQANLLYNVTITLKEDASDSTIKDFKFYSFNKESIVLDGVENVVVRDNEFTVITNNNFESKVISVVGGCNFCNIIGNNIYINSMADYTYAISVSEPPRSIIKRFSEKFTISNNNILIKSTGVAEGMYFDALVESDVVGNNINIISDGSAYGIAVCDVMGKPHDINIDSNKIIVNSKEMSYLIELYRVDNSKITNNYLKGISNGVFGIGVYNSNSIINGNEIVVVGKDLSDSHPADALGKGNSAVYITRVSQINEFKNNIIDSRNCGIINITNSNIKKITSNAFVISNYNYYLYFNSKGGLFGDLIKDGDMILFKNFTDSKTMNIDVCVEIKPYEYFNEFKANLVLLNGSNKSSISGFNFDNAKISLNNVSEITITLNNFTNSQITDDNGVNNNISNNSFLLKSAIVLNNCFNNTFECNDANLNSSDFEFISIIKSIEVNLSRNSFEAVGSSIRLITSNSSNSTLVLDNNVVIKAGGEINVYVGKNTFNDRILNNTILINALTGNPTAIYYNNSFKNVIKFNRINSYSKEGQDYAIIMDSQGNTVTNNYLISSNGFKRGNEAVKAINNTVHDNVPVNVYVSTNGSDNGNGTFENPYLTVKKAIENSPSGTIICILPDMYNESDIVIDKNITLTAINLEGNTYINALNSQLFNIKAGGILTVNALKIFNGFCVDGGSLFNNRGTLIINNSVIYNSSSYYDNSNPTFKYKSKYDKDMYSFDCTNLGLGGAILNYGELYINSSTLFNNFAHKGGALADFGKTTIKNSLICNNTGVHGGAIYTNSSQEFTIENCEFRNNLGIQTLDHCFIKRIEYENYPNMSKLRYRYIPICESLPGIGGAIFSNTPLKIDNSLFDHNVAKYGGAISYGSNILNNNYYSNSDLAYETLGSKIKYSLTSILNIKNSVFTNNEAKNTSCGNLSMLVDDRYGGSLYDIHATGGAIFGALREFKVYNTTFENNLAESNGGALCVQSLNSSIEASKFLENTAGERGGALDLFGNFEIFNTEIINNSAKYGGAVQYKSYTFYERVQNNLDMFNVTVAGNKALKYGGAFNLGITNFAIKNSNIYDNFAPESATLAGGSNVDARGNWWGSIDGPDDSIYQYYIKFRTWLGQKVDWGSALVSPTKNNEDAKNTGNSGNSGKSSTTNTVSTGSGTHTGSTLSIDTPYSSSTSDSNGFNFNGNWPSGNNKGNNGGFSFNEDTTPFNSNGNSKTNVKGNVANSNGNSKTNVKGNVANSNSLSKTNSSSINNLASVGMTANAADSSMSSQSSPSSDDGNGGSEGVSKAYEITKDVKKEINLNEDLSIFNILFVLLWIFLFIGFYRRYKTMDEN